MLEQPAYMLSPDARAVVCEVQVRHELTLHFLRCRGNRDLARVRSR